MSDFDSNHLPPAAKPARKPRVVTKKPQKRVETHYGKKTLVAAVIAAAFAILDAYMTIRHGVKLPL